MRDQWLARISEQPLKSKRELELGTEKWHTVLLHVVLHNVWDFSRRRLMPMLEGKQRQEQ